MNKKIKAIFCDLDGTLLTHESKIATSTFDQLNKLNEEHIPFIIATGRSIDLAKPYYEQIKHIDIPFMVCSNGAIIYDTVNKTIDSVAEIDNKLANKVIMKFREIMVSNDKLRISVRTLKDPIILVRKPNETTEECRAYWKRTSIESIDEKTPIIDILAEGVNLIDFSCLYFDDAVKTHAWLETFRTLWPDLEIVHSGYQSFNITHKAATKGSAVKKIMNKLALLPHEVLILGDSGNDISMFKVSENSITREDAHDYVKDHCKYIINAPASIFVGEAINDLIFKSHKDTTN